MLFQSQFYVLAFLPITVLLYYAAAGFAAARQWVRAKRGPMTGSARAGIHIAND